jgi:hypothetical protein
MRKKGNRISIVYITDNHLPAGVKEYCMSRLRRQARKGKHQLIEIKQDESAPRCHESIYKNILTGLKICNNKLVMIAEHDCIYSDDYFEGITADRISYNNNVVYLTEHGFGKRELPFAPLSSMAGQKTDIEKAVKAKMLDADPVLAEPEVESAKYRNKGYIIDVRHGQNFTGGREEMINGYLPEYNTFNARGLWADMFPAKIERPIIKSSAKVSCIITSRVERHLRWTVENVMRTAPSAEIIIVHDGWTNNILGMPNVREFVPWVTPQGVGPSRHYGILQASNDTVILLDAHMDFKEGWTEILAAEIEADKKTIACSRSAVLREDRMDIDDPEKIQGGAVIDFNSPIPCDPQWQPHTAGEINCVLGATYAMSKDWYLHGLRSPWKGNYGWGSSEQILSLVNFFAGGRNVLTEALTGHLYRHAAEVIETRFTEQTRVGMWYNRLRFIDLLPVPRELKQGLIDAVRSRSECKKHWNRIEELFASRPDRDDYAIKEMIRLSGRTMGDYIDRWYKGGIDWRKRHIDAMPEHQPKAAKIDIDKSKFLQYRGDRRFVR